MAQFEKQTVIRVNVEIWKEIEGYEGYYAVSNYGNVKSLDRTIVRSDQRVTILKGRQLIPWFGKSTGYLYVTLSKFGVHKKHSVHRLIALAFIPNPENKKEVNHKDGNKLNNDLSNLEWCTPSENINHAYARGLITSIGNTHYNARKVINCRGQVFDTIKDAARHFSLKGKSGISDVCRGVNSHAGRYSDGTPIKWSYLNPN